MAKHILGSTLAFVAGMLIAILLLVVGLGAAAFFIASATTVDKAETMIGIDFFEPGSELGDKTLWELGTDVYKDYHNLGNLTINDLKKYGVKIPDEVEGINITSLFDIPFKDIIKDTSTTAQKALDCITLGNVIDLIGLENPYKYPLIAENKDLGIRKAIDKLMGTISDTSTLTIRWVKDNLNLDVGSSSLLDTIFDVPLSSLANIIDKLTVGMIIGVNQDLFVEQGVQYQLYAKLAESDDNYIAIEAGDELNTHANADECLYSSDDNGLIYKELRYVKKSDGAFQVDNSCWSSSYDASKNDKTFYYHKTYVNFTGTNASPEAVYFHPVTNYTIKDTTDSSVYVFEALRDYVNLNTIYYKNADSYYSVSSTGPTYTFAPGTTYYYKNGDEYVACGTYGIRYDEVTGAQAKAAPEKTYCRDSGNTYVDLTPAEVALLADDAKVCVKTINDKTRLTTEKIGYIRFRVGTSDGLIQSISHVSIKGLNDIVSTIETVKLGDVIKIDDSSTQILKSLKETTIGGLSNAIDNLRLDSVLTITYDTYELDPDGNYVKLASGKYELLNPADPAHAGLDRYRKLDPAAGITPSAKALQALGSATIKNMSTAFDALSISDVMDIKPNKYAEILGVDAKADLTVQYYKYEDGAFLSLTNDQVTALDDDATVYYVTEKSTDNAILAKLAYLKVNTMANSMTKIVDDTLLTEILTVNPNSIIEENASGSLYLFEQDINYTSLDVNNNYVRYAFAPDTNGGYYQLDSANILYQPANSLQMNQSDVGYFKYEKISDMELESLVTDWTTGSLEERRDAAVAISQFYYQTSSGSYSNSYLLSMNVLAKCTSVTYATNAPTDSNPGIGHTFFRRVNCLDSDPEAVSYPIYSGSSLYISRVGFEIEISPPKINPTTVYVAYDPADLTMANVVIYYQYADGKYVVSPELRDKAETDNTIVLYKNNAGSYELVTDFQDDPTVYADIALYTPVAYYYCPVDKNMPDHAQRYEKVYCEDIIIKDGDTETHVYGYLTESGLGGTKYSYIKQRSSQVLLSIEKNQVRVGNLGDKLLNFKIRDLITIQPDSILNDETILDSKLDNISNTLNTKLTNLKINELLTLANISKIEGNVKIAISDLKLEDLFGSLVVDTTAYTLKVDMLKLFNPHYYDMI